MNLDLNNSRTITILIIVVVVLFAIIYVWINSNEMLGNEGFVNYPVAVGDIVQLQGGLVSVMDGATPVPSSINNMIQQALNTFSNSLSYPQLFGIMNYSVSSLCNGTNAINNFGAGITGSIPTSPNRSTSGICLFNWAIPNAILYDSINNSNVDIISSFNPNTESVYTTNNIFSSNNLIAKKYIVDLTFSLWMNDLERVGKFNIYLITFGDNSSIIRTVKLGNYSINTKNAHLTFNIKFIVPKDSNMKNWGIYLFNNTSSQINLMIDSNDNVSISVYTM